MRTRVHFENSHGCVNLYRGHEEYVIGDLDLSDWGVQVPQDWESASGGAADAGSGESEADEVERKKREFEERIKAGEISEEDEEYQAFLDKFKLKKTTDDSEQVFAEREKVERENVEREKAERWELSDRERAIVAKLSEAGRQRLNNIN